MNILQFSVLKNAGCSGGCKFCGLSAEAQTDRQSSLAEADYERAFAEARMAGARLEIVFPTVGANQLEVFNLLIDMQPVIRRYPDVQLAVNPGICTRPEFYNLLPGYGVSHYRNNLECSRRLFRDMVPLRPLAQYDKLRSLALARDAGLKTDTGWLCGLGEDEADIEDMLGLLEMAASDSITLNYFDPREAAEQFDHTTPSLETGLNRLKTLRARFESAEITLGGAYEFWLGANNAGVPWADGVYIGRFLDHGLREERMASAGGCC